MLPSKWSAEGSFPSASERSNANAIKDPSLKEWLLGNLSIKTTKIRIFHTYHTSKSLFSIMSKSNSKSNLRILFIKGDTRVDLVLVLSWPLSNTDKYSYPTQPYKCSLKPQTPSVWLIDNILKVSISLWGELLNPFMNYLVVACQKVSDVWALHVERFVDVFEKITLFWYFEEILSKVLVFILKHCRIRAKLASLAFLRWLEWQ